MKRRGLLDKPEERTERETVAGVWKRQIVKLQQVTDSSHARDRCNHRRLSCTLQLCVQSRACEMHALSFPSPASLRLASPRCSSPLLSSPRHAAPLLDPLTPPRPRSLGPRPASPRRISPHLASPRLASLHLASPRPPLASPYLAHLSSPHLGSSRTASRLFR